MDAVGRDDSQGLLDSLRESVVVTRERIGVSGSDGDGNEVVGDIGDRDAGLLPVSALHGINAQTLGSRLRILVEGTGVDVAARGKDPFAGE